MDREAFYTGLETMLDLTSNTLLIDSFPVVSVANTSARILRLGLAVNAFASLEAYVRACFDDLVAKLASSTIPYLALPKETKEFLIVKASKGLVNQGGRHADLSSRITFFETEVARIASFSSNNPLYSSRGFSPQGSNVGADDIASAFRAFGVNKPWNLLNEVVPLFGAYTTDLRAEYLSVASDRNRLAHEASSNIPTTDLQTHIQSAIKIGIAVDCCTTIIGEGILSANQAVQLTRGPTIEAFAFRFIDKESNLSFVERGALLGRVVKRYASLPEAQAGVSQRSSSRFVIRRDTASRPIALVMSSSDRIK